MNLSECPSCRLRRSDKEISDQLDHCELQRHITNGNVNTALRLATDYHRRNQDCLPSERVRNIWKDVRPRF